MTVTQFPGRAAQQKISREFAKDFLAIRKKVAASGLLRRRYGYYATTASILLAVLAGLAVAFAFIGDSWWQLLIAAALGVVLTQFAFIGHDAAHMQIFNDARRNRWVSLGVANLVVGLSYGWWDSKHSKHHDHPNKVGTDPDIDMKVISFTPEQSRQASPLARAWYKRQGYLFFLLVCLEGLHLHYQSFKGLFAQGRKDRWIEATLLVLRVGGLVAVLFLFLSPGVALAFLGVQMAVFGFYMGCSFAPNHKGMPIVPKDLSIDFFRRQVLMSRNIRGGYFIDFLFGGLNYQIEHHLFPNMPRAALRKVAPMIKEHCRQKQVPYTEVSMRESYGALVAYLNRVGLGARDPFDCPLAGQLRLAV